MTLLRTIGACLIAVAFSLPAVAQTSQTDAQEPALPYSPSLNLSSMDKSIDPCAEFLPVRLRRLAKAESDPSRAEFVERVRQAV